MTEAMNFIQSIFTNPYFSSGNLSKSEIKLAHGLTREARESASRADEEARNGLAAQKLAVESPKTAAGRDLGTIALWHYEQSLKLYREAIDWFEQASRVWPQAKRRKLIRSEIGKMIESAAQAESSIEFLNNNFFEQN
jgi:hypothetical protein